MYPLFFIPGTTTTPLTRIKRIHNNKREKERREPKPTPYALAAIFTAEDSGAIEPGDNPPVAFFTQLSDVFLDDDMFFGFFFVSRVLFLTARDEMTPGIFF